MIVGGIVDMELVEYFMYRQSEVKERADWIDGAKQASGPSNIELPANSLATEALMSSTSSRISRSLYILRPLFGPFFI